MPLKPGGVPLRRVYTGMSDSSPGGLPFLFFWPPVSQGISCWSAERQQRSGRPCGPPESEFHVPAFRTTSYKCERGTELLHKRSVTGRFGGTQQFEMFTVPKKKNRNHELAVEGVSRRLCLHGSYQDCYEPRRECQAQAPPLSETQHISHWPCGPGHTANDPDLEEHTEYFPLRSKGI